MIWLLFGDSDGVVLIDGVFVRCVCVFVFIFVI